MTERFENAIIKELQPVAMPGCKYVGYGSSTIWHEDQHGNCAINLQGPAAAAVEHTVTLYYSPDGPLTNIFQDPDAYSYEAFIIHPRVIDHYIERAFYANSTLV